MGMLDWFLYGPVSVRRAIDARIDAGGVLDTIAGAGETALGAGETAVSAATVSSGALLESTTRRSSGVRTNHAVAQLCGLKS